MNTQYRTYWINMIIRGVLLLGIFARLSTAEPGAGSGPNAADDLKARIAEYKLWKPTTSKPVFVPGKASVLCRPFSEIPSEPHGFRYISFYINPNARDAYSEAKTKQVVFPEGTVIVKEKRLKENDEKVSELGIMLKRQKGFSPETGDWQYGFIRQNGELVIGTQLRNCAECHSNAKSDSVFGHPAVRQNR